MAEIRKCLVIGGSEGLGLAIAAREHSRGSEVAVLSRKASNLSTAPNFIALEQDLNDLSLVSQTIKRVSPTYLYLCAAEAVAPTKPGNYDSEVSAMRTNFVSTIVWLSESFDLLHPGSRVAWISSLTAVIPIEELATYSAAKAGVEHFLRCMRTRIERESISLTVCYPGCLETGFHAKSGREVPESAASPDSVVDDLLFAVDKRDEYWAADSDRAVVNAYAGYNRRLLRRYRSDLVL